MVDRLRFGRAGRGSVELDAIVSWDMSGRTMRVRGTLHSAAAPDSIPNAAQLAALMAERARLVGYQNNLDEETIPVTWECDPTVDGFYHVRSLEVNYIGASARTGIFELQATLEQVLGQEAPQFEKLITGAGLTTNHAVLPMAWFAHPTAVTEQTFRTDCITAIERATPDGDLWFTDCDDHYSGNLKYYLTPADFYIGAAEIEIGDPLEIIVGTQIERTTFNWRINNGLVRVEPNPANDGTIDISHWDGAAWTTPKQYTFFSFDAASLTAADGGDIVGFSNVSILRNSPESCTLRLSCVMETPSRPVDRRFAFGRSFLDVTLRQGDRNAEFIWHTDRRHRAGVRRTVAEAASALTGGIAASANDAAGDRYVFSHADDFDTDLAQGEIRLAAAEPITRTWAVGVGLAVDGSAAATLNGTQELIEQHYSGQSERLLLVAR